MADPVELLPDKVYVKIGVPRVNARVEVPAVAATVEADDIPVVIVPGKPGPPGKDGAVIGGAIIDDGAPSPNRVWSSEHTNDADNQVVEGLTPNVDLTLLFNNALA